MTRRLPVWRHGDVSSAEDEELTLMFVSLKNYLRDQIDTLRPPPEVKADFRARCLQVMNVQHGISVEETLEWYDQMWTDITAAYAKRYGQRPVGPRS